MCGVEMRRVVCEIALGGGQLVTISASRCRPPWLRYVAAGLLPDDFAVVQGFARLTGGPANPAEVRRFTRPAVACLLGAMLTRCLVWICDVRDAVVYERLLPRLLPGCGYRVLAGSLVGGRIMEGGYDDEQVVCLTMEPGGQET